MINAVIFDMDGLLIDSEPLWRKAEIKIFRERGIVLTENDCRGTTGMRVDEVVTHWSHTFPDVNLQINETVEAIMDEVTHLVKVEGKALPGVFEAISFFETMKTPMALASASSNALIDTVLTKLEIKEKLQVIQSAEFMNFGKPHPEVFIETAKRLNISVNECLVFEDSIYGVIAGKAAKMLVVAVPDRENFDKKGYCIADKKIRSMSLFNNAIWEELNQLNN
ncbi:MAG: hexitol phosphatase HxpB [Salinivirgaceae bacterium]